ncbi:hypothetical protein ACWDV4_07950 [Micromonospora sp. NPDC003197]
MSALRHIGVTTNICSHVMPAELALSRQRRGDHRSGARVLGPGDVLHAMLRDKTAYQP